MTDACVLKGRAGCVQGGRREVRRYHIRTGAGCRSCDVVACRWTTGIFCRGSDDRGRCLQVRGSHRCVSSCVLRWPFSSGSSMFLTFRVVGWANSFPDLDQTGATATATGTAIASYAPNVVAHEDTLLRFTMRYGHPHSGGTPAAY